VAIPALSDGGLLRDKALIGGAWVGSDGGATFAVHDPSDNSILGSVPDMGAAETRRAIEAAEAALAGWAALPAKGRSQALRRWYDLVIESGEDLARLVTAEQGKPLAEARGELGYAASFIEWFAEEAKRVTGEILLAPTGGRRIHVLKQPIGVCAAITPWNFPLAMITRKAGAALAAGCTMVVKPAEATPLSALALGELALRAGIPAGVLNVVTARDPAPVGAELCANPVVRKLSFTGSTEVGRILLRASADTIKKCSLELGGNAPLLVFADCDIEVAVRGAMIAKFRNGGQSCIAANRILVEAAIHDRFVARLAEAIAELKVGPGTDPLNAVGPLIDSAALAKVERHVDEAVGAGALVRAGGARHALGGNFFAPTLLVGADPGMSLFREETFGPVAAIFSFEDEAEAVALANDSRSGLAAYLFTRDLGRALRVSEALEYGMVGINEGLISNEVAPFGGIKESGLGREGSSHGIEEYLEMKYVCIGNIEAPSGGEARP
jgi:succinate-semialdehyde dehydrogenase/glutarate-semialdehyde dehydrogenase